MPREDRALVELVVGESEPRARAQRAARAREPAVVRVLAELLVLDAHVVGPRQDLRVRALHVVRLVERVDDDLPVRGQHGRSVRAEPHLVEVVRVEQPGERVEEVEQRLRVGVEVHEHEAAPASRRAPGRARDRRASARTRRGRRRRRADRRASYATRGTGSGSRRPSTLPTAVGQPRAAVQACVVERA